LYDSLADVLVILVVAVLVWPVAIVSWLGRVRLVELARTRSSRARWPRQL
jgi:hypothetical protein